MARPSPCDGKTSELLTIQAPNLFPLQREIATHPARFKVVLAGRRFGKTRVGSSVALQTSIEGNPKIIETVKRGGLVWWVAPVYAQSEIVYELLKPLIAEIPGAKSSDTKLAFFLPNGGALWCKSADKPDRLRGRGLDGLVIDEADFIEGHLWTKTLRPALSDRKGWALFLSTPNKRGGWFHKLYLLGQAGTNPHWMSWHCPSVSNPYLDPAEVEAAKDDMTKEEHDQEYGAIYVDSHELVYFNFDEQLHVNPCPVNLSLPVAIGLDFNNKPRVAVFIQREGLDTFRVIGELHHTSPATTDQHAQMVAAWLTGKGFKPEAPKRWGARFLCYPDASGKALRHSGGTNILDFAAEGFASDYPEANPDVVDRDNIVLSLLLNANKRIRLIIDPSCKHLIEAFKNLKHKGRDGSPWGHILDALGYALHRMMTAHGKIQIPITAPAPTVPLQRQGRALPRV